jgi:hypothetical protein
VRPGRKGSVPRKTGAGAAAGQPSSVEVPQSHPLSRVRATGNGRGHLLMPVTLFYARRRGKAWVPTSVNGAGTSPATPRGRAGEAQPKTPPGSAFRGRIYRRDLSSGLRGTT